MPRRTLLFLAPLALLAACESAPLAPRPNAPAPYLTAPILETVREPGPLPVRPTPPPPAILP